MLCVLTITSLTAESAQVTILTEPYKSYNAYKAIAQAYYNDKPLLKKGKPILGYAWNYDTAKDSVKAAKAYCRKAGQYHAAPIRYKIIFMGETPVLQNADLDALINEYEQKVINDLRIKLKKTGKRELITRLSTILQKTGEYQLSEELLFDLAMAGEHLAQNALAYHWAELKKNLPKALLLSNSAISKDPGFFSYHDTRALVLFRLNRKQEAVKASSHAVSLKAHPIALDHYGDILWETNKRSEAVRQWERAAMVSNDILFIQRLQFKINNGMTRDIIFE
jgi:predicted Zn-dependent protease